MPPTTYTIKATVSIRVAPSDVQDVQLELVPLQGYATPDGHHAIAFPSGLVKAAPGYATLIPLTDGKLKLNLNDALKAHTASLIAIAATRVQVEIHVDAPAPPAATPQCIIGFVFPSPDLCASVRKP